jgi:regulator of replication initiation timing
LQQQQVFGSVLKELTGQLEKLRKKFKRSKNSADLLNSNTITTKLQDLIIEQWVYTEQTNRDKRSYEWQAKYFSNKLLATEQVTEKLYSELKISETMTLELSKNYREQLEMQESHSASRVALLNSQLTSLGEQTEKLKQMCLSYESQNNQLQIENHNLSDHSQLLEKKLSSFEIERKAAFADARSQIQDEIQGQLDERDISLKNYFDSEIVRILSLR